MNNTPSVQSVESYNRPIINDHKSPFIYILAAVFILVVVCGITYLLHGNDPVEVKPPPPEFLEAGKSLPPSPMTPDVPSWLVILIIGFICLQMLPLILAAHKSRARLLSCRDIKAIIFLVETPMYLGLLGTLVGICLTQFISGSLSAPVAYLTTIAGLLFYLAGRFAILVPLPISPDAS